MNIEGKYNGENKSHSTCGQVLYVDNKPLYSDNEHHLSGKTPTPKE